jgi:transcriptional regulator with XRE-family HTH domain
MISVQQWSGREAALLRAATRMSLRDFADHLGVAHRTVSLWEEKGATVVPRGNTQAILDTALERFSADVRARFAEALVLQPHLGVVASASVVGVAGAGLASSSEA